MKHTDEHNAALYDRDQAHQSAKALFRDGGDALKNADFDKPVKMFGLFDVDAGLAAYANIAYNVGSDYATRIVAPKAYGLTKRFASGHMSQSNALKTAALTTTAMNVVLKSGGYFTPMISTLKEGREERETLARRVSPVLDETVGKHSVGALNSAAKENTVLKAHLKRMSKKQGVARTNNLIDLIGNAGPNLVLNYKQAKAMWGGQSPQEFQLAQNQKAAAQLANDNPAEPNAGGELKEMGKLFMQGGTGAFTDRLKKSNNHKLDKTLRPYSALEMILTLDEQFKGNSKSRSYQVPGRHGSSYPLEEYIARIAIHHYAEMADIDTEYSEIREALHDELAQAVKPIAEAMRKGEFDTMNLVRLIGEGKLVQKGGRTIASADEVRDLVENHSAGHGSHSQSAKEHYANAAYNRDELKKAINALSGDEQRIFASFFSNEVLEDAGFKPAQIKTWRDATTANRDADKFLAESTLGICADGHDAAAHDGVASKKEIALLEKGSLKIARDGVSAVHDLRGSSVNPHGIEQAVANVAVAKIIGDKSYFGTMLSKGQERLAANENNVNDNERGFAQREERRAAGGHHEHEI